MLYQSDYVTAPETLYAVLVALHERVGVRQRRRTLWATRRVPLREAVETAMWAKFHVDEEAGAGGGCHVPCRRRVGGFPRVDDVQ